MQLWRRHRQIVGLAVLAVVVALGCVALGRWQWHRYQDKHDRKQLVERNYDAPAVPLRQLLPTADSGLDPADQWRPVRVTGRYDAPATTLVRNRPHDVGASAPAFGYEVLVPLVLDDGSALLVDRGWVPSGTGGPNPAQEPDVVPPPPDGTVDLVVRLRPSEPTRGEQLPPGQVASIAVGQVARATGLTLRPAYGVLVSESPAAEPAPALLERPELDGGEGINASYAVQWLLFAALALGFPFWFVRRQRAPAPAADLPRTPVATTARKRRIWDDEEA